VFDKRRSCSTRFRSTGEVRASVDDVSTTVSAPGTGNALLPTVRRRLFSRVDVQTVLDAACAMGLEALTLKNTKYRSYPCQLQRDELCSRPTGCAGCSTTRRDERRLASPAAVVPDEDRTDREVRYSAMSRNSANYHVTLYCQWNASTEWRTSTAKQRRHHRHHRHLRRSSLTPCLSATN